MFFIFSKILFFLLMPFWWIVILLLWRWRSKHPKTRKRLLAAAIIIAVVFTNPFLFRTVTLSWQVAPTVLPQHQVYEAGIILGGLAGYDKNNVGHFGNNVDRFVQTANLYHQGVIKKIIVSGGTGKLDQDEPPESLFLREQFIANGVNDSDIILETRSRNTYENAVYSKQIADSLHLRPPFILVTSAIHMRRSIAVFKRAGFSCIPYPCDYKVSAQKFSMENTFIPSVALINGWSDLLKEIVGLYVYKLTGKA